MPQNLKQQSLKASTPSSDTMPEIVCVPCHTATADPVKSVFELIKKIKATATKEKDISDYTANDKLAHLKNLRKRVTSKAKTTQTSLHRLKKKDNRKATTVHNALTSSLWPFTTR